MNIARTLGLGLLATTLTASAQLPHVDITLVPNGNDLEVKIRPDADFNGVFSSLLFTIRWNASDNASLGSVGQVAPAATYMPTDKAGNEIDNSGYRYQVFAGFGFSALSNLGTSWLMGVEYTIMTIPVVNGSSTFSVINDSWTGDVQNNGDYYVSLNGSDQTGSIYQGPSVVMGSAAGTSVTVVPNPSDGLSQLVMNVPNVQDVRLTLHNAAGQIVWSKDLKGFSGKYTEELDLRSMSKGVYMLHVAAGGEERTHQVVLK